MNGFNAFLIASHLDLSKTITIWSSINFLMRFKCSKIRAVNYNRMKSIRDQGFR